MTATDTLDLVALQFICKLLDEGDTETLDELEHLVASASIEQLAQMEIEELDQDTPDTRKLGAIRTAAIILTSNNSPIPQPKLLCEEIMDYFEKNGPPEKWLCTLDQFFELSLCGAMPILPGVKIHGCLFDICETVEESGPVVSAREVAEERIGEMADHEQKVFDDMWDSGSGAYAERVINLARSFDKIILGKVHEFCNQQQ